jgi:hypothetical protein
MTTEQGTLFDRRKYSGVLPQSYQIAPPRADQTVLKTLPAYHAYLSSGAYSKYTPDDFTSDLKKFGLYLDSKALKDIQAVSGHTTPAENHGESHQLSSGTWTICYHHAD